MGFFTKLPERKSLPLLASCGQCGRTKTAVNPKMALIGEGRRRILVIGECPTEEEDKSGEAFTSSEMKIFAKCLRDTTGIVMSRDCWMMYSAICAGPAHKGMEAADHCRPNIFREIKRLKPTVIILVGLGALKSVIGHIWKEVGDINRWTGWHIPSQELNAWVVPVNHPEFLTEMKSPVLYKEFDAQISKAVELSDDYPWKTIPNYKDRVKIITDEHKASERIASISNSELVAFDYETTCLKPDDDNSRIVCCSLCNGKETIAFPWTTVTANAMRKLIRSPCGKIASNMKFEERWTRAKLKTRVRNWVWDTMLAAHVIDNRDLITSIKFQAFVLLGQPDYDSHMKPFLVAKEQGSYSLNTIHQADQFQLLLYCGLDSILEYEVAKIQMGKVNYVH